jgi:hypothetical protein
MVRDEQPDEHAAAEYCRARYDAVEVHTVTPARCNAASIRATCSSNNSRRNLSSCKQSTSRTMSSRVFSLAVRGS